MPLPPLLAWYGHLFETELVLAVLLSLVLVAIAVILLRTALQLFLIFLILLLIAIGASYLFQGEEQTERDLRRGAQELQEAVDGEETAAPPKTPR
jgi:predicted tellurium resistance membrane protein TerC